MLHSTHVNHVSVCPTNGIGPTQGQKKTLTRAFLSIALKVKNLKHRPKELPYMGHVPYSDGVKINAQIGKSVLEMSKPGEAKDIYGLNGSVNYLKNFC